MSESNDHVLPNGFTFLAASTGLYGSWAKGIDPITAIKDVFENTDGAKNAIWVVYGKNDELKINDYGGFSWHNENPPVAIGLFTVTNKSIKPTATGDFNETHGDCREWMEDTIREIELSLKSISELEPLNQ